MLKRLLIIVCSTALCSCSESGPSEEQAKLAFIDAYGGPANVQVNSFSKIDGKINDFNGKQLYTYHFTANVIWLNGRYEKCVDKSYFIQHNECWGLSQDMIVAPGTTQNVVVGMALTKSDRGWQASSGKTY